ncbi:hypothetical protein F5Y19DRAFT_448661 [Xylariaceae sp. FL1651]|nr:hypothetical protein F5Y19DRAFT_448661 [Xylariaceae sp. FL1651]
MLMADPLSVGGLALGVVSLGIQVYSGVKTYIDAITARGDELASIQRRVRDLQSLLRTIQSVERKLQQTATSPQLLTECLTHCETELQALHSFLVGLCGTSTTPGHDFAARIQEHAKKLSYYSHRKELSRLEMRLDKANQSLNTALEVAGIDATTYTIEGITDVQQSISQVTTNVELVQQSTSHISTKVDQVQSQIEGFHPTMKSLSSMPNTLGAISLELALIRQLISAPKSHPEQICEKMQQPKPWPNQTETPRATTAMTPLLAPINETTPSPSFTQLTPPGGFRTQAIEAEWVASLTNRRFDLHRPCSCLTTPPRTTSRTSLGFASFFVDYKVTCKHQPSCHLASRNRGSTTRELRLGLKNMKTFLFSISPSIMFHLVHGFGNLSISPSLTCVRIIKRDSAAFRIIDVIFNCINNTTDELAFRVVHKALEKLLHLFREGRFSLRDITTRGETILDYFFTRQSFRIEFPSKVPLWLPRMLINFLQVARSLGARMDDNSSSSFFIYWSEVHGSENAQLDSEALFTLEKLSKTMQLLGCDTDTFRTDFYHLRFGRSSTPARDLGFAPRNFAVFSDAGVVSEYSFGPLGLALHNRDARWLRHIISSNPQSLTELGVFNLGCLALALKWPRGLRLLIDAFRETRQTAEHGRVIANAHDQVVAMFNTIELEESHSRPLNTDSCGHYPCMEILQPLLELGLQSRYARDECGSTESQLTADWNCNNAKRLIVNCLRVQRESLKRRAIDYLTLDEIREAHLCQLLTDDPLDSQAGDVTALLEKRGFHVPENEWVPKNGDTVFMTFAYKDPVAWDLLWEVGFRGISENTLVNSLGYYHPVIFTVITWHLSHGVDINSSVRGTWTVAHTLAAYLRLWSVTPSLSHHKFLPSISELIGLLASCRDADGCECWCTSSFSNGCIPITLMLRSRTLGEYSHWYHTQPPAFLDHLAISSEASLRIIRILTFQRLGLRHTCCVRWGRRLYGDLDQPCDDEEVAEIHAEDDQLIKRLEALMKEFENEYGQAKCTLREFIRDYWTKRMTAVMRELEGANLSEAELNEGRRIGIQWADKDASDSSSGSSSSIARDTFEYWERILDKSDREYVC